METYKPITDYEGLYEISDHGNVKRVAPWKDNWGKIRQPNPNPMKPGCAAGYAQVQLAKDGIKKSRYVHRLVAIAFIGPCPKGYEVNHRNGQKSDNHVDNLEYVPHRTNLRHAIDVLGRKPGNFSMVGVLHHNSFLTEEQVIEMRTLFDGGMPVFKIAKRFNVSHSTTTNIVKRKTWKHL